MKCLMHEIVCSDIRLMELKLKRIRLCKRRLLEKKPSRLRGRKLKEWYLKLESLENQEEQIVNELHSAYSDLEKFL